jgi:predicted GNAT family acetyltransferase
MPTIRILEPRDQPALEAFTLPLVETSMFLIGNSRAAGLVDHGQPYEGTYAGAFEQTAEGERMAGVVAHYWNQMLILQTPQQQRGPARLDALCRAAVRASGRPISGLIGPAAQVRAARKALGIDAGDTQMDEEEKLYSLSLDELVVPEGLRSGRLVGRRIEARDVALVTDWKAGLSVEALGDEDGPQLRERLRASVERAVGEGRTWLLEDRGTPVSTSGFQAAIGEAVQIGGVYTPPEFRRRGYARAVVATSLLDARAEGVERAILFTGEGNLPAQRAYTALGFRHIGDYGLLILREPVVGIVE